MSTPYPPTTSESSLGSSSERSLDSSSPSSRPSRKRCRSPTASVPSSTHVSRSIAPTPADLLPPRKRFRDSYSPEDSGEEHMEVDTADAEAVADIGISEGVVAHPKDGVGMGFEIAASDVREDDEEFEAEASAADTREIVVDPLVIGDSSESSRGGIPDLEDTIYDIVHYMSEVRIDRITEIETTQRQLETSQMVASGERASLVERIRSLRLEYLKVRAMLSIERDRIDSIRWHMALSQEEFRQVRRDRDDTHVRDGGKFYYHQFKDLVKLDFAPYTLSDIIVYLYGRLINRSILSILQRLVIGVMVYFIWQEQNLQRFQAKSRPVRDLCGIIRDNVRLKLMSLKIRKSVQRNLQRFQAKSRPVRDSCGIIRDNMRLKLMSLKIRKSVQVKDSAGLWDFGVDECNGGKSYSFV
ncbi:hypothetical protein Tco_0322183 [Tanacetum coccineum]